MAFPTIQTADTKNGTVVSNSNSWTLTYPTNLASGDLILAFVATDGGPYSGSWPAGWVVFNGGGGSANSLLIAKRKSDGTETGTFTLGLPASEQGGWRVFRITGWDGTIGTTFANDANTGGANGVGTVTGSPSSTPDPPSNSPVWGALDTLWFAVCSLDTSRTISVYPYTGNNSADVSGGAGGATLGICTTTSNTATLNPGTFTQSASDDWVAGTIGIKPASGNTYTQTNAGGITFAGTGPKNTSKVPAGGLTFTGLETRTTSKSPGGALSFVGVPAKVTSKSPFAGSLPFGGAISTAAIFNATLAGAVSFAGTGGRTVLKSVVGVLSFAGEQARVMSKTFAGALSFAGSQTKSTLKAVSGSLSFAGGLTKGAFFTRTVSGALSFTGIESAISFFTKTVSGALSFVAGRSKTTLRPIDGALTFAGTPARRTSRSLAGSLSFVGPLSITLALTKTVAGAVSFLGTAAEGFIAGGGPPAEPPQTTRTTGRRSPF